MIINIFSYLTFRQIQIIRLVCKRFEELSETIFIKHENSRITLIENDFLNENESKLNTLKEFRNFRLNSIKLHKKSIDKFLEKFGKSMKTLEFYLSDYDDEIKYDEMNLILKNLNNLDAIKLEANDCKMLLLLMKKFKSICFELNNEPNFEILENELNNDIIVKELLISPGCDYPLNAVLKSNIIHLLKIISKTIKKLNFLQLRISSEILIKLIEYDFNLEEFEVDITEINTKTFNEFTKKMKNLIYLKISGIMNLLIFKSIKNNLSNLKNLNLFPINNNLTNDDVKYLSETIRNLNVNIFIINYDKFFLIFIYIFRYYTFLYFHHQKQHKNFVIYFHKKLIL